MRDDHRSAGTSDQLSAVCVDPPTAERRVANPNAMIPSLIRGASQTWRRVAALVGALIAVGAMGPPRVEAVELRVRAGSQLDVQLDTRGGAAIFRGRLTDDAGLPVAGAGLLVTTEDGVELGQPFTEANGAFLHRVPPAELSRALGNRDTLQATVVFAGSSRIAAVSRPLQARIGATPVGLRLSVVPPTFSRGTASVRATVEIASDGEYLPNHAIQILLPESLGGETIEATTESDGRAIVDLPQLGSVEPGEYRIEARSPATRTTSEARRSALAVVTAPSSIELDVSVTSVGDDPGVRFAGRVDSEGQAVAGAVVALTIDRRSLELVSTDSDGEFEAFIGAGQLEDTLGRATTGDAQAVYSPHERWREPAVSESIAIAIPRKPPVPLLLYGAYALALLLLAGVLQGVLALRHRRKAARPRTGGLPSAGTAHPSELPPPMLDPGPSGGIVGWVRDDWTRRGVAGAEVRIGGARLRTDSLGRFGVQRAVSPDESTAVDVSAAGYPSIHASLVGPGPHLVELTPHRVTVLRHYQQAWARYWGQPWPWGQQSPRQMELHVLTKRPRGRERVRRVTAEFESLYFGRRVITAEQAEAFGELVNDEGETE